MAIVTVTTGGPEAFTPTGQTILQVCQNVAPVVGLAIPTSVFGASSREMIEMCALANEMAKRIAFDGPDWSALRATAAITGDGTTENTPLPADYRRMVKDARLWSSTNTTVPLLHIADSDEWLELEVMNLTPATARWTIMGGQMLIKPAPAAGATIKYVYISDQIVSGSAGTEFAADSDKFVLDSRVLRLGMIWQWKANKGQPYAEDMATYETALSTYAASERGPTTRVVGRTGRMSLGANVAYPFALGS